ncbi:MAG: PIG-L deacetylase family protein [Chloroflexota bacterium]
MTGTASGETHHDPALTSLVGPTASLVVISPHLDDAVLSCGDLLRDHPGAVVVTAFAGRPMAYPPRTSWDERAGFEPGADVVAARRAEDGRALAELGASPRWLDFPDPQYGLRPHRRELTDALKATLDDLSPDVVVAPLGIFHDDHALTGDAALDVLGQQTSACWLVYADAIYRNLPDLVNDRLRQLSEAGLTLREVNASADPASDRKRRAVACYSSQVQALERSWKGGVSDAFAPERYWQIVAPTVAASAPPGEKRRGNR